MEKAFEKPVKTPGVKSRTDAWLAWEASQLKKYKGPARPKSIFWSRWKSTKADLFDIISYKQYTGEIVYRTTNGSVRSVNLMESERGTVFNSRYFLDLLARFNDEYPKLQRAQALVASRPSMFEMPGTYRWGATMGTILAVVKVLDSMDIKIVNALPKRAVVIGGPTWYDVWSTPDDSELPVVTMVSIESRAQSLNRGPSNWLLAGGFMATDFYTLLDVLKEKGVFEL